MFGNEYRLVFNQIFLRTDMLERLDEKTESNISICGCYYVILLYSIILCHFSMSTHFYIFSYFILNMANFRYYY